MIVVFVYKVIHKAILSYIQKLQAIVTLYIMCITLLYTHIIYHYFAYYYKRGFIYNMTYINNIKYVLHYSINYLPLFVTYVIIVYYILILFTNISPLFLVPYFAQHIRSNIY